MKCIYCNTVMDLDAHTMEGDVEIHRYTCPGCNAACMQREDSNDLWDVPEPLCSKCDSYMQVEDVLDNGTIAYVCECGNTLVLEPNYGEKG